MTRPTDDIEWATDGGASVTEPPSVKKLQGWIFAEKPPAAWLNWLLRALWRWIAYLDTETTAAQLTAQRLWTMANLARLDHAADLGTTAWGVDIAFYNQYSVVAAHGSATNTIWRSSNYGKSWALDTSLNGIIETPYRLAFNSDGSVLVVVGNKIGGTHNIATSSNYGDTWTGRHDTGSAMYGVCHSGTLFVAVGAAGAVYTSSNGTTWTSRTAAGTPANITFHGVCWSAATSLFVAVGTDSTAGAHIEIQTSPDGITWTARTAATTSETLLRDVEEIDLGTNTYLIAVGDNGVIQYSSNGTGWSNHAQTETTSADFYTIQQVPTGAIIGTRETSFCLVTNLVQRSTLRFPEDYVAPALAAEVMAVGYSSSYGIVMTGISGNVWQSFLNEITGL